MHQSRGLVGRVSPCLLAQRSTSAGCLGEECQRSDASNRIEQVSSPRCGCQPGQKGPNRRAIGSFPGICKSASSVPSASSQVRVR